LRGPLIVAWVALMGAACMAIGQPYAHGGDLLSGYERAPSSFKRAEIGDYIVYWRQGEVDGAIVEGDLTVYQFDGRTGALLEKRSLVREDAPSHITVEISRRDAELLAMGEVRSARLYIISPDSRVFPLSPPPANPCWVVKTVWDGELELVVIDAVTGDLLGVGIPPPYLSFSLSGPMAREPCAGAWEAWYENAASWFERMGYSCQDLEWPDEETVAEHVGGPSTGMFYELAHGNSSYFSSGCSGGQYYGNTYAYEIRDWIEDYPKMPFAFIGSCEGMCDTGEYSLSHAFRKGSAEETVTVGYCLQGDCDTCWLYSVGWQDELFRGMYEGMTVKEAFDAAMAAYPMCYAGACMRFAGDEDFAGPFYRSPEIIAASVEPDDSSGNGDSRADPGEEIGLTVNLYNNGPARSSVSVDLSTQDPHATVTDGHEAFSAIGAGESVAAGYSFTVGGDLPSNHDISFQLAVTYMGGEEEEEISVSGYWRRFYVDCENTEGPWDGTSENPYRLIQDGLDNAPPYTRICVARGTYIENLTVGPDLELYGGYDPATWSRDIESNATAIDGDGAGSVVAFDSSVSSTTVLSGFTITNGAAPRGGGIICDSASPRLLSLNVTGNAADSWGGGIYFIDSFADVSDITVSGNGAGSQGGGIACNHSPITVVDSEISDNAAGDGGGLYFRRASSTGMVNTVVAWNTATYFGGGIYCMECSCPVMTHCIVADNDAGWRGGGMAFELNAGAEIVNSVLWGNTALEDEQIYCDDTGEVSVGYSDVQGGWVGEGVIDDDPLFADVGTYDYHLCGGSPCVDAGEDAGVDEDIDGEGRPFDGDGDGTADADMGVDEFVDSDGDGLSDLCETGAYGTDPLAADTDGDGLSDYEEVYYDGDAGYDPYDPVTNPGGTDTDAGKADTDGDGWSDSLESRCGGDPLDADAAPAATRINFEPALSPLPLGYCRDGGLDFLASRGYGWR